MAHHDEVYAQLLLPQAAALCETFFFGVYSALFAFSTFFMLRKGFSNRTTNAMLAVSIVMYTVSASHWALNMFLAIRGLRKGEIVITPAEFQALVYLPAINYILSDSIVLWRAWVLWNRRSTLFIPPLIFLFCTLVSSVTGAVMTYECSITNSTHWKILSDVLRWSIWGFTVGTNLWATCLIFIRAWQNRRFLRSHFVEVCVPDKAERALSFLVESGALYLVTWATFITIAAMDLSWVLLFRTSIVQLVGIYPTAIFVVVTVQMTAADNLSRPGRETRPSSPSIIFSPRSPTCQPVTVEGSSDSDSFVGPRKDESSGTLVLSGPGKGEETNRTGYVT